MPPVFRFWWSRILSLNTVSSIPIQPRLFPWFLAGKKIPLYNQVLDTFQIFPFYNRPSFFSHLVRPLSFNFQRATTMHKSYCRIFARILMSSSSHRRIATRLSFLLSHALCSLLRINSIDYVRNFSSLYFGAQKSPVGQSAIHRISCLFIFSSLFHEIELDIHECFHAITEREYRSTEGEIIGYRLFNQIGRFDSRSDQMLKFCNSRTL